MEGKILIAGIYSRVSSERQVKEGYSIDWQENELADYCTKNKIKKYFLYTDKGKSSLSTKKRTEYNKLVNDITTGKVNCVIVYKMDRLTRCFQDYAVFESICKVHNCIIFSTANNLNNTTEDGEAKIRQEVIDAERESKVISRRVKNGKIQKARKGEYNNNNGLFGYNYERNCVTGKQEIIINYSESVIVKEIFSLYLYENKSELSIAKYLTDKNVVTKRKGNWTQSTIHSILTNKTYIGYVKYLGEYNKGIHDSIIEEDIFDKVQDKMKSTKKTYKKMPSENVFFAPRLYCSCGCVCKPKQQKYKNKTYLKYYCTGDCKGGLSHELLENNFNKLLNNIKLDSSIIIQDDETIKYNEELDGLILQRNRIEKQMDKLVDLHTEDKINCRTFEIKYQEYKNQKILFNKQISDLEQPKSVVSKQVLKESLYNLSLNWNNLDKNQKQSFIRLFIEKIIVEPKENDILIKDVIFN